MPQGRTTIIRAAKDPPQPPTDPAYTAVIQKCLCRVKMGPDCYIVTGITDAERIIPYGAPLSEWVRVCGELLELGIKENFV
jgi:hypothetical protein